MFFKLFLGETEEELRFICTLFVPESIERKQKLTLSQAPEGRIILVSAHTIESKAKQACSWKTSKLRTHPINHLTDSKNAE